MRHIKWFLKNLLGLPLFQIHQGKIVQRKKLYFYLQIKSPRMKTEWRKYFLRYLNFRRFLWENKVWNFCNIFVCVSKISTYMHIKPRFTHKNHSHNWIFFIIVFYFSIPFRNSIKFRKSTLNSLSNQLKSKFILLHSVMNFYFLYASHSINIYGGEGERIHTPRNMCIRWFQSVHCCCLSLSSSLNYIF